MNPLTKAQRIQALAVLGLPGTATLPEITAAYRVLDNKPAPARIRPSAQIYSRPPAHVKIEPPIVAGPTAVVPTLCTRSHQRGVL